MISDILLHLLLILDTLCLIIRFLVMSFSMPSLGLTTGRLSFLMEFLLLFLEILFLWLHPALSSFFLSLSRYYLHHHFPPVDSLLQYKLLQRRTTSLILQTINPLRDLTMWSQPIVWSKYGSLKEGPDCDFLILPSEYRWNFYYCSCYYSKSVWQILG